MKILNLGSVVAPAIEGYVFATVEAGARAKPSNLKKAWAYKLTPDWLFT